MRHVDFGEYLTPYTCRRRSPISLGVSRAASSLSTSTPRRRLQPSQRRIALDPFSTTTWYVLSPSSGYFSPLISSSRWQVQE